MTRLFRPEHKIISRTAFVKSYGPGRNQKVVFTNGVFDILHRGHVEYLYAARDFGEVLVVGLNTDASVRRLKGPTRPLNSEADRAIVLAGLGCVDAVCLFDEDTPGELISELVPDVLVKGADYSRDQVVGRNVVEAAGGRLVLIPLVEGKSTTSMIHRMQEDKL